MNVMATLNRRIVLGGWIALVATGCRGPESPLSPDAEVSAALAPTGVAGHDLVREARQESGPSAICSVVGLEAATPERIGGESCQHEYLVRLAVHTRRTDSAAMRMSDSYDIADWRIQIAEQGVRHEMDLIWRPYRELTSRQSAAGRNSPRSAAVEPLIVRFCPEDGGPIVGCSDTNCETYGSERDVPRVLLPAPGPVFKAPWSYENVQNLQEASSLDVRLRYWLPPGQEVSVGLRRLSFGVSARDFRIMGGETVGGDRRLSGEVKFTIDAELDAAEEPGIIEEFGFVLKFRGEDPGCVVAPNRIRVQVGDR